MRDAFGGIVNIVFVAIFLLIISGILGLIVNYTKAFRMKNTVISAIEQYEGAKGCFSDQATGETGCRDKILKGAEAIGYHPPTIICSKEYIEAKIFSYSLILKSLITAEFLLFHSFKHSRIFSMSFVIS